MVFQFHCGRLGCCIKSLFFWQPNQILSVFQGIAKNGIKYIESTRELEDNIQVQTFWHYLEHTLTKRARTYKKQLA